MLHCKFSRDYNSERIFKIGQYLTKLCEEPLGFTFLAHTVREEQRLETPVYTNELHSALMLKNGQTFWKCVYTSAAVRVVTALLCSHA